MKINLTAIILSIMIILVSFSNSVSASIAEETSVNETTIAWADESTEDSPELKAKVKALNQKWAKYSNDSSNSSYDSKKYSYENKKQEKNLDTRLKEIDEKWAKSVQKEKDEAERLRKQEKKEKDEKEYYENLDKKLKEIDARYND